MDRSGYSDTITNEALVAEKKNLNLYKFKFFMVT
jgi:hypothetical protein